MSHHKTGILGGTFNPVHRGHIELGEKALKEFHLNQVLYVLSANPPHKQKNCFVDKDLRWKMLTEALKPYPKLIPSDFEMKRPELSWSLETVRSMKIDNPSSDYYFISGSEGFLKIESWRKYREILEEVVFLVALRKPEDRGVVVKLLKRLNIPLIEGNPEVEPPGVLLFSYESDKIGYSSTGIRDLVSNGENPDLMLTGRVKEIIKENRLYER